MKISLQSRRKIFKNNNEWSGGYAEILENKKAYISIVFSWNINKAIERALDLEKDGYSVKIGGPAAILNKEKIGLYFSEDRPMLQYHNPNATFTTRGCIRKCEFCAVPKIEKEFIEIKDFEIKPIICDNNFLASSTKHFDLVIDKLKTIEDIDFNQGLDARLLTDYHAQRFRELKLKCIRLAWDNIKTENKFIGAYEKLRNNKIPKSKIRCYVLIGFNDTPEDAVYRLETCRKLGIMPNPMRYQPLASEKKNEYVDKNWTHSELQRYMRYWSNLRYVGSIPFNEFTTEKTYLKEK